MGKLCDMNEYLKAKEEAELKEKKREERWDKGFFGHILKSRMLDTTFVALLIDIEDEYVVYVLDEWCGYVWDVRYYSKEEYDKAVKDFWSRCG